MNEFPSILIVDDERNIRLTLSIALEALKIPVDAAASGEEALAKLSKKPFKLMVLDLKLPGLDGLEVLRRVSEKYPDLKVIIITAYGSVEVAVDAMKAGAVDFLQKPFNPTEVRDVVSRVLKESPAEGSVQNYQYYIVLAQQSISAGEFVAARVYAKKAIFINPNRPEAFNILGGLSEVWGDRHAGNKNYRIALELEPTYEPARQNLERVTSRPYTKLGIVWG